jgi:hypothetical protein
VSKEQEPSLLVLKFPTLPKWCVEWAKAIFNPLPWVMTLWYVTSMDYYTTLPYFSLHEHYTNNTICRPFVDSISNGHQSAQQLVFLLYSSLFLFYFIWYWKTSKPKWICWGLHSILWFYLTFIETTYANLWMMFD